MEVAKNVTRRSSILKTLGFSLMLTLSQYSHAGVGQSIANMLKKAAAEMMLVGGGLLVIAIIIIAYQMIFGSRQIGWKVIMCGVGGIVLIAAPEISDFITQQAKGSF